MNDRLPSFCTPLDDRWPLPVAPPDAQLRSTRFDPALLQPGDFALTDIQSSTNILRAVAKRQAGFLAGRLCARATLFALDSRTQTPVVGEDHAPVWSAAISGSIIHSDHWVVVLVATRGGWHELDLDVETLLEAERVRYLHGEILTESERLRFADSLKRRTGLLVALAFSLKKSLFKALYPLVGKRFYFKRAELLEWHAGGQARLHPLTDLSPEWRHGSKLNVQLAVLDEHLLSLMAIDT